MTSAGSDLIEEYALGALGDRDRRLAELVIATDGDARQRFEAAMSTLDALDDLVTEDVEAPGDDLLMRIRAAAGLESGPGEEPAPDAPSNVSIFRRRMSGRFGALAAIAAVFVFAALTVRIVQLDSENRALRESLAAPLDVLLETTLADPDARTVTLSAPTADGRAVSVEVVYLPDGTGYLIGDALPALNEDRTYQLWAIVGDRVISAGVFGPDPHIAPFQVAGTLAGLALTEEVTGGVVTSAESPVALWLAEA